MNLQTCIDVHPFWLSSMFGKCCLQYNTECTILHIVIIHYSAMFNINKIKRKQEFQLLLFNYQIYYYINVLCTCWSCRFHYYSCQVQIVGKKCATYIRAQQSGCKIFRMKCWYLGLFPYYHIMNSPIASLWKIVSQCRDIPYIMSTCFLFYLKLRLNVLVLQQKLSMDGRQLKLGKKLSPNLSCTFCTIQACLEVLMMHVKLLKREY